MRILTLSILAFFISCNDFSVEKIKSFEILIGQGQAKTCVYKYNILEKVLIMYCSYYDNELPLCKDTIVNFEIKDVYAILNEIHQQNSQEIKVVKCVDCTSVNISMQGDSINEQFSVVGISFDRQEMTLGKISKNLEGLIGRLDSIHCWSPAELEKGKSKLLEESGTVGN
jgi:hypothetical protein